MSCKLKIPGALISLLPVDLIIMEDRLHGLADSFRRERDDALRRKMTAQERLSLKKQEVEAMSATLKNLQDKHKQLKIHLDKADQNEELRKEVLQLTKEVSPILVAACLAVLPRKADSQTSFSFRWDFNTLSF